MIPNSFCLVVRLPAFRRIKIFDRAAQFGKVRTNALTVIHLADRAVKKAVRLPGCFHDFLATHIGQLVNTLAEFGAVHVLREQIGNIAFDFVGEL
jgi:hypothetical protein